LFTVGALVVLPNCGAKLLRFFEVCKYFCDFF